MKRMNWYITLTLTVFVIVFGAFVWNAPAIKKATSSLPALPFMPKPTKPVILLRNNTQPFFGPIMSKEGETLVIKNPDGKNVTVTLSSSTKITGGKMSDLLAGKKVSGVGKVNEDGSIVAQTIQINPQSPLNK